MVAIHYFANGLEEQAEAIIAELIPAALERDPNRRLGDIAVLYTDYNDGNLVSAVASSAALEYIRIDNGAPIPTSPLIRWLQECAEWCAGGWRISRPKLRSLISLWLRFNPTLRNLSEGREAQRRLVEFLFGSRNADQPLKTWLAAIDTTLLQSAFSSEGTLREEQSNVSALRKLTEKGKELENATIATFSGQGGSPDHLNLITLHSAKGLEYEVVFLLGMDQGRLPSWADKTSDKLAEARRRFYVGLTRAKREVHLTYSGFTTNKAGQRFNHGPSPFLLELERRLAKQS